MSQANIALFHAKLSSDAALLHSLTAGASSLAEVAARAVAVGHAHGFDFSLAEAEAWLAAQDSAAQTDELSDSQLAAVAGGNVGWTLKPIFDDSHLGRPVYVGEPKIGGGGIGTSVIPPPGQG